MAAASKTASGFHSMPHRNGTYVANHGSLSNTDVTPDLHLKMSKKIAQLTKVIYALNTKNDEHENVVENLKLAHEEEIQQLIAETTEKINYFKSRIGVVSEQKQQIDLLESHLARERLQREEAMSEFETFKRRNDDQESRLRSEYSEKILSMSKELLAAKKQFEDRLKDFHASRKKLEEDRDKAVEELSNKHHHEMDQLMKAHRVRYDEVVREKEKLEKDFQQKIAHAQSHGEIAAEERRKIEAEYQGKVDKLKAFYENELAASRAMQRSFSEAQMKEWDDREKALKSEWARQERVFKDRISELLNQLSDGEKQMSVLKSQLNELESKIKDRDGDSAGLVKQLEESRQEAARALRSLRESESDLTVSKKRCEEQETEIARLSMQISKFDAAKLSQETAMKELKSNTSSLQSKLNKLESEHDKLGKQFSYQTIQADSQIKRLQQDIENLTREKHDLESKYHTELERASEQSTNRETSLRKELEELAAKLKREHQKELDETTVKLNKSHENHVNHLQIELQEKLAQQEKELSEKAQQESERLLEEKNKVLAQFERDNNEVKDKLKSSEAEVERLEKLVQDSQQGLSSASSHIDSLKQVLNHTKEELQRTQRELKGADGQSAKLKEEIERLQKLHESALNEAEVELNSRLEALTKELDFKWSERLGDECSKLRSQLNEQHREENRTALEELTRSKDFQKDELRMELQNKIDSLKKTVVHLATAKKCILRHAKRFISELRSELEKASRSATMTELELRKEVDEQRRRMEEELGSLSYEHNKQLHELEEKHKEEIKRLEAINDEDMKELENRLLASHREEMCSQLQASKLTVDAVRSQAEQKRESDVEELKIQHENEQENLRSEMLRFQQEEMHKLNREFEVQLAAVKLQLQRTKEGHAKEETEYQSKLDEMKQEIEERDCQIKELDKETRQVRENVEELQRELQAKGQEILAIRREANSQIRKHEEDLGKAHQKEVDSLVADHLRETQTLLTEFNRSKELLTDKISALQLMLEEAEEKFRNRQSRPEDLEIIEQLKRALAERELDMKKLVDEKRYFQLELLNRETNFNKVFKASPNIGVINPLQAKTKPRKEARQTSAFGVTSSRLDPIPDMPVHERRLNNSRPLPPTPPKEPSPHRKTSVY